MAILEVSHVKKIYTTRFGGNQVEALKQVSFSVEAGEYVAIIGESGSGKTTLLNILAALDRPTAGEVRLNGQRMGDIREKELDLARIQEMPGIVGYLVQEGDTLWDIARDCLTTPEKIREWNQLGTEEALPGTRLLILKNIPSSRS